jgi:hypothetical protein
MPIEDETNSETKTVRIVNNLEEAVTLDMPASTNATFKTELKTLRPGKEFELSVTALMSGHSQAPLTIHTSSTNNPTVSVNAVIMPQPAISTVPQQISVPAAPLKPDYHYPATVRNNSHIPLKLSNPSVNADGVTVQLEEVEPGKTFRLNLSFPTNVVVEPGQPVSLSFDTSNPKRPNIKVPITQLAAAKITPVTVGPPPASPLSGRSPRAPVPVVPTPALPRAGSN